MTTNTLLVEIFTEELPPKALAKLGESFAERLVMGLKSRYLLAPGSTHRGFATPRRLAVSISGVLDRAPDSENVNKIPASVALTSEGRPSIALLKKLGSRAHLAEGLPDVWDGPDHLYIASDGKADYVFFRTMAKGTSLQVGLEAALEDALETLPIPKVMRYQTEQDVYVEFVRPAHGLIALHGSDVVPVSVLGLQAGRVTHGHRFQCAKDIMLANAGEYESRLRDEGGVIASFVDRRAEIERQLNEHATALGADLKLADRDALCNEVTALVEMPTVYVGEFEKEFLAVPQECLILTMQANQKYFPLFDGAGKLLNKFLIVSNMRLDDPKNIVEGNQRVIRPRLADARFFYEQDKKIKLADRVPQLASIVYHNKLGTQLQRVERLQLLAAQIARMLTAEGIPANEAQVSRAAYLSKADLLTNMVGEFPELQGIMGTYYARSDGEDDVVSVAIEGHYHPRFSGDTLPESLIALCVALADRLYAIVGMFNIGQEPTGDKDPFALRRAALGVIRMLIERDLPLTLLKLVDAAQAVMPQEARGDWARPLYFVLERARGYFAEQGFDPRAIDSVLTPMGAATPLGELPSIVREATKFIASDEGRVLAEANKRITNILKKSGFEVPFGLSPRALKVAPDAAKFRQSEECALFGSLLSAGESSLRLREERRYAQALAALVPLSAPTKAFFDNVMVNTDEIELRDNRICLLQHARAYMNLVADLSLMAS